MKWVILLHRMCVKSLTTGFFLNPATIGVVCQTTPTRSSKTVVRCFSAAGTAYAAEYRCIVRKTLPLSSGVCVCAHIFPPWIHSHSVRINAHLRTPFPLQIRTGKTQGTHALRQGNPSFLTTRLTNSPTTILPVMI